MAIHEAMSDPRMKQGEMLSLLATMIGQPKERIGGWAVIIHLACGAEDCVGLGCEEAGMAFLSAGHTIETGMNEPYLLHMLGSAVDTIAQAQRDRKPS